MCDGPFGSDMKSAHYSAAGVRLIRLQNIGNGAFDDSDQAYVPEAHFRSLPGHDALPGDLLVAGLGDTNHPVGRGCLLPSHIGTAMVKADCFRLRLDERRLLHRFVVYFLGSGVAQPEIANATRGATRSRINLSGVAAIRVPLPPLSRQHAIVAYLDRKTAAIDALIAKKERLIELLDERGRALISHVVTKGLDPNVPTKESGVEWLGRIPAHWDRAYLNRAFDRVDYGLSDTPQPEGRHALLRMGNLQDGELCFRDLAYVETAPDDMLLEKHDLLFNRTNSLALVGKVGIFRGSCGDRVTFASYLVRLRAKSFCNPEYLLWQLNMPAFLAAARSFALPSVSQANLNPTRYGYLRVCLPPREEQDRIVARVAPALARVRGCVSSHRDGVDLLREYRQALITAAVTGKIDVSSGAAA